MIAIKNLFVFHKLLLKVSTAVCIGILFQLDMEEPAPLLKPPELYNVSSKFLGSLGPSFNVHVGNKSWLFYMFSNDGLCVAQEK